MTPEFIAKVSFGQNPAQTFRMRFNLERSNHKLVYGFLQKGSFYEPDVSYFLIRCLKKGDTFVDVGANQGYFSLLASTIVGENGEVFSIEPGEDNLKDLEFNKELNDRRNITVVSEVLSNTSEEVTYYSNADDSGGHAIWNPAEWPGNLKSQAQPRSTRQNAQTLDALFKDYQRPIKTIKIDTEGAEELILRGGRHLIERADIHFFVVELHEFGLQKLGCSQSGLRQFMQQLGYHCFVLGWNDNVPKFVPPCVHINPPFIPNLLFCRALDLKGLYTKDFIDPEVI